MYTLVSPSLNRRRLLGVGVGTLLVTSRIKPLAGQPVGTPGDRVSTEFPELPNDIRPVPVSGEVDLLYVRVMSGIYGMTVVGEFQSQVDAWITAPPILLRFDDGIVIQPFIKRPDIAPFGRGQFEDGATFLDSAQRDIVQATSPDAIAVDLCDFDTADADSSYGGLTITSSDIDLEVDQGTFTASVTVANQGEVPAPDTHAFALIYDERGYYCGELRSIEKRRIASGEAVTFAIELGNMNYGYLNPFEFVGDEPFIVFIGGHAAEYQQSCV